MARGEQGGRQVLTGLRVQLIKDRSRRGTVMSHATLEKFKRGPRWKKYRDMVAVLWDCPDPSADGTIASITFEKMRDLVVEGKDVRVTPRSGSS